MMPKKNTGKIVIDKNRCKGCQLCIECCPTHVLQQSEDFNDAGYHYPVVVADECICCQGCCQICPDLAVFAVPRARDPVGAERGGMATVAAGQDASAEMRQ